MFRLLCFGAACLEDLTSGIALPHGANVQRSTERNSVAISLSLRLMVLEPPRSVVVLDSRNLIPLQPSGWADELPALKGVQGLSPRPDAIGIAGRGGTWGGGPWEASPNESNTKFTVRLAQDVLSCPPSAPPLSLHVNPKT